MKRIALIFNSDYQTWPLGGMISYITQTVAMLSDTFEIDLWGCSVNGKAPEPVKINQVDYRISVCANARTGKKLIPNVVRCFCGTMLNEGKFSPDRYDILYFHLSASALGWFCGKTLKNLLRGSRTSPLVIMHQHGMAYGNKIGNFLNYSAMNRADLVFFTTDRQSLETHRAHVKHPHVAWMPSMIDTDFFSPVSPEEKEKLRNTCRIPADRKVFIYTGRITAWKNPLLLLEAFEEFQRRNDHRGILIYVGDGEMLRELEQAVQQKDLSDSVILTGRQPRTVLRDYLRLSDVFVLPSKGEGVSVSALEAMSTGLRVVGFQVEGMTGLVDPRSGILIKDQTAGCFADAMDSAIHGSFTPRTTAMEYSVENVKEMMIRQIQHALQTKGNTLC